MAKKRLFLMSSSKLTGRAIVNFLKSFQKRKEKPRCLGAFSEMHLD